MFRPNPDPTQLWKRYLDPAIFWNPDPKHPDQQPWTNNGIKLRHSMVNTEVSSATLIWLPTLLTSCWTSVPSSGNLSRKLDQVSSARSTSNTEFSLYCVQLLWWIQYTIGHNIFKRPAMQDNVVINRVSDPGFFQILDPGVCTSNGNLEKSRIRNPVFKMTF